MAETFNNAQLLDLAGNALSSSAFAAVYMSTLAELPDPVATVHDGKEDSLQELSALMSDV